MISEAITVSWGFGSTVETVGAGGIEGRSEVGCRKIDEERHSWRVSRRDGNADIPGRENLISIFHI